MIKRCVDLRDCFDAIEELMKEKDNRISELEKETQEQQDYIRRLEQTIDNMKEENQ